MVLVQTTPQMKLLFLYKRKKLSCKIQFCIRKMSFGVQKNRNKETRISRAKTIKEVANCFFTEMHSMQALCLNSNILQVSFAHIFRISRSEQPAHNPGKRQYIKAKL